MFAYTTTKRIGAFALSGLLVTALLLPYGVPRSACADELSDAQAALDSASAQLDSITAEYEDLQAQASALDEQISQKTQEVVAAQAAMKEGQEALGVTVLASYKNGDSASLINVFLQSTDLDEFLKNLEYYSAIQEEQSEQVAEQMRLRDEFSSALEELDAQRDAQQELLDQAAAKKEEAEKVVSEASDKVDELELEKLQAQAAAMAQQQQAAAEISSGWNTKPGGVSSSSGTSAPTSSGESGWYTGVASAYGGSSDSSTPNPGITATGAVCNDSSMGVAVPMAWANYRSYFGRAVEIRYNGKTVVATVNDCGGMGGGSRSLDLQPGVFKAFGYSTCQAWGLRTVSYRFL